MAHITIAEKQAYIAQAKMLIESAANPKANDSATVINTRAQVGMALLALAKVDD